MNHQFRLGQLVTLSEAADASVYWLAAVQGDHALLSFKRSDTGKAQSGGWHWLPHLHNPTIHQLANAGLVHPQAAKDARAVLRMHGERITA